MLINKLLTPCFQCFDTVVWTSGTASGFWTV